jgi:predicted transcriptional regulator
MIDFNGKQLCDEQRVLKMLYSDGQSALTSKEIKTILEEQSGIKIKDRTIRTLLTRLANLGILEMQDQGAGTDTEYSSASVMNEREAEAIRLKSRTKGARTKVARKKKLLAKYAPTILTPTGSVELDIIIETLQKAANTCKGVVIANISKTVKLEVNPE